MSIKAEEADIGRVVVYRSEDGDEVTEGTLVQLCSIPGLVSVRYGHNDTSIQMTSQDELEWAFPGPALGNST